MPVCRKPLTVSEHAVDKLIQPIANSLVCELSRELSCVESEATLESRVLRDSQVSAYFARSFENGDNSLFTNSWFS